MPRSNAETAKEMRCIANLVRPARSFTTPLFHPTYLLLETIGIRNVLLRQAKTDREKESAPQALPSSMPNK